MLRKIFLKQIKEQIKSINIWILIVAIFLFYYTQFIGDIKRYSVNPIESRIKDEVFLSIDQFFGITKEYTDLEELMEAIYNNMKIDYESGKVLKIKGTNRIYEKIDDEQKKTLYEAITEIEQKDFIFDSNILEKVDKSLGENTVYDLYKLDLNLYSEYIYNNMKYDYELGNTLRFRGIGRVYEKINNEQRKYLKEAMEEIKNTSFETMDEYDEFMGKVDVALGGHTIYNKNNNITMIMEIKHNDYEKEIEKYNTIVKEDKITNAYGRLFADYIGIATSLFTVFITAFTLIKDKRYSTNEIIYTTRVSSYKYIIGKYLGDIIIAILIVLLVAARATWVFHGFSKLIGESISYTAFFKYSILWIFPTIMFVTSLSYVLQLIFDNGIVPIIFQFFYWRYSVTPLIPKGIQPTKYFIRFNRVVPYSEFQPLIKDICLNRILFTLFALILLFIAIKLWDRKRGNINSGFKIRKKGILH
ncbi:ABC transporter permease [Tissierella praeacuta]|uniref:ABC transporter permease n=1 Tax=Tissierella praeacuta TaxID=43131 RepID=UPI00333E7FCE